MLPLERYALGVALSSDPVRINKFPSSLLKILEENVFFFSLLSFDFSGAGFSSVTAHSSNIYKSSSNATLAPFSADGAVDSLIKKGLKSDKLVLGIPVYGHCFRNTQGLGQPFHNPSGNEDTHDYSKINVENAQIDKGLVASWLYTNKTLISLDTVPVISLKAEYIKHKRLAGAMFWAINKDKNDENSLIAVMIRELRELSPTGPSLIESTTAASQFYPAKTSSSFSNYVGDLTQYDPDIYTGLFSCEQMKPNEFIWEGVAGNTAYIAALGALHGTAWNIVNGTPGRDCGRCIGVMYRDKSVVLKAMDFCPDNETCRTTHNVDSSNKVLRYLTGESNTRVAGVE